MLRADQVLQDVSFPAQARGLAPVAKPVIFGGRGLPLGDFGNDDLRDVGRRKPLPRELPGSKPCPRASEMLTGRHSFIGVTLSGGINCLGVADGGKC